MYCLTNQTALECGTTCSSVNYNTFLFDCPHRIDIAIFQIYCNIYQIEQKNMFYRFI